MKSLEDFKTYLRNQMAEEEYCTERWNDLCTALLKVYEFEKKGGD